METGGRNRKGRGLGYVLAANSCEGVNSVAPCTATAPDVITAFAVPNPGLSSQTLPVFSGLAALQVALPNASPSLLRADYFLCCQPFQPSTGFKLNVGQKTVNNEICAPLWTAVEMQVH